LVEPSLGFNDCFLEIGVVFASIGVDESSISS
jgi:hypothetical protein